MSRRTNDDENRESRPAENWLTSIARVYGTWHLTITAIQVIVWTAFVYWNESGKHDALADVVQTTVEKMVLGVPGFSILSIILLVIIQKGGRVAVTFIDERRNRLKKEREEGIAVGVVKGRAEGREEGRAENQAAWTAWNSRRIEAEKRGERFDEPPPGLNGR